MNQRYREYLRSDDWQQKRREKLNRRGGTKRRCAICGTTERLDVHHLRYERDLTQVQQRDLRLLCRTCHDVAHDLINRGVLVFRSESHHSRFESTKAAVKRVRAVQGWKGGTPDWVLKLATLNGGWTKAQLAEWGVPWPPPKGWKTRLLQSLRP